MRFTETQERIRAIAVGSVLVTGGIAGMLVPWGYLIASTETTVRMILWWCSLTVLGALVCVTATGLWRLRAWARTSAQVLFVFAAICFAAAASWSYAFPNKPGTMLQALIAIFGFCASLVTMLYLTYANGVKEAFR
jgi:fucose 4-O-acetylase-like acetyltransferase